MQRRDLDRFHLQRSARFLTLIFAVAALRCGHDEPPPPPPDDPRATVQLGLSPSNPRIAQGTGLQFALTGLLRNGKLRELTDQVTWSLSAEDGSRLPAPVAGLVEPGGPGRYLVTAEYAGRAISTPLTVTTAAVRGLAISPTSPRVAKGLTQQFTATATLSDGSTQDVTALAGWSVKDTSGVGVAVLSSRGLATARSVGMARITARYATFSASALLEVTAATLTSLTISPSSLSLAKGTSQRLVATGTFSDATVQDVSTLADWTVLDVMGSGVGSIDGNGLVLAESVGQAKVSADYSGRSAEIDLTVTAAVARALSVGPATAAIAKGTTQQFTAALELTDGTRQPLTTGAAWSAEDVMGRGIAAVDSGGLAKGQAAGLSRIRCSYLGFTDAAQLEVRPAVLTSLVLSPASVGVPKGLVQAFQAAGTFSDGSTQDLTGVAVWSASDVMGTDVLSLSAAGAALAKNLGQAQVRADAQGKSATAMVQVTAARLQGLALMPQSPAIAVGATRQFSALGSYSDGTIRDLSALSTFSVTDIAPASGVASLTAAGLATGKAKGRAKVKADYLGAFAAETTLSVALSPEVCSEGGWCWSHPQPQGNDLRAVWSSGADDFWFVGQFGTILRQSGGFLTAQKSGTQKALNDIHGLSGTSIWAVGAGGTLLKWDGGAWSAQSSGTTADLNAVWAADASNVWAVGSNGTIL